MDKKGEYGVHELDVVKLKYDFHGLTPGTIGTIVLEYDGTQFEVEFIEGNGNTIEVLTTPADKIELVTAYLH